MLSLISSLVEYHNTQPLHLKSQMDGGYGFDGGGGGGRGFGGGGNKSQGTKRDNFQPGKCYLGGLESTSKEMIRVRTPSFVLYMHVIM